MTNRLRPSRPCRIAILIALSTVLVTTAALQAQQAQRAIFRSGGTLNHSAIQASQTSLNAQGVGEVQADPQALTMLSRVSGSAELASDALVKYRDAKRRALETLNGLKIDGLEVKGLGMSLNFLYDQNTLNQIRRGKIQAGQANAKAKVVAGEGLRIRVSGLKDRSPKQIAQLLVKLIDTTQDAGLVLGGVDAQTMQRYGYNRSMSAVAFETKFTEAMIGKARQEAIDQARARAKRIADQAGVRLGPVLSINQNVSRNVNRYNNNQMQMFRAQMAQSAQKQSKQTMMSGRLGSAPVRVNVNMRFAILPPEKPKTSADQQQKQNQARQDGSSESQ